MSSAHILVYEKKKKNGCWANLMLFLQSTLRDLENFTRQTKNKYIRDPTISSKFNLSKSNEKNNKNSNNINLFCLRRT